MFDGCGPQGLSPIQEVGVNHGNMKSMFHPQIPRRDNNLDSQWADLNGWFILDEASIVLPMKRRDRHIAWD